VRAEAAAVPLGHCVAPRRRADPVFPNPNGVTNPALASNHNTAFVEIYKSDTALLEKTKMRTE